MLFRASGWGIVIYAIMYLAWSGLVTYGLSLGVPSLLARLLILFVCVHIAVGTLRLSNWKDILPYSLVWALVAICMDALFLVPFTGWQLFASWSVWMGYAFVALLPTVLPFLHRRVPATARVS